MTNQFRYIILVSFIGILLWLRSMPVLADDASLGRAPDGVYPLADAAVVMTDEDVKVKLLENGTTAEVTCDFTFYNDGAAKDVLMGFPASQKVSVESEVQSGAMELRDFKAFIDGQSTAVKTENGSVPAHIALPPGTEYDRWYTFTVPFQAGETRQVRNTYRVKNLFYSNGEVVAGYILRTGAFWKDPVGHARVTFDLGEIKPYQINRLYPNCYRFAGNTLVFERENFEPSYDLEITFDNYHYSAGFLNNASDDTKEKINGKINLFTELEGKLAELAGAGEAEIRAVYNAAVAANDPFTAQFVASRLPAGAIKQEPPTISAVEVKNESGDFYRVSAKVRDPNADFTFWEIRVIREENGKKIIDLSDRRRFLQATYDDELAYGLSLEPGKQYWIEFEVWDADDHADRQAVTYRSGDAVPQVIASARTINSKWLFAPLGMCAMVAAAVAWRRSRHFSG
ncbi:MAG: hypothetical protein A4E53_01327 [Pelotomaculum sp. PtaB.Bin104]|nr:MAG: hypothetical protein A4E53_01327 [Pelotomaculum sp. PtaB.Bin104]